jgi:hypothetical protein
MREPCKEWFSSNQFGAARAKTGAMRRCGKGWYIRPTAARDAPTQPYIAVIGSLRHWLDM